MGDYIPQEELEKFLAACNDAASQKATREAAERAKIQADNVGHKLLSKMGWKEGASSLFFSISCICWYTRIETDYRSVSARTHTHGGKYTCCSS